LLLLLAEKEDTCDIHLKDFSLRMVAIMVAIAKRLGTNVIQATRANISSKWVYPLAIRRALWRSTFHQNES